MNKVVYCKITSWKGMVFGAEHCYVDLVQRVSPRNTIFLNNILTFSEAERMNRRDNLSPSEKWKAGEEVTQFFSKGRAERAAIKQYKTLFPGAVILVEGRVGVYQPQLILDGPSEVMEALNDLVSRVEWNNGWEGNEVEMESICEEWEAIWIPEFEEE